LPSTSAAHRRTTAGESARRGGRLLIEAEHRPGRRSASLNGQPPPRSPRHRNVPKRASRARCDVQCAESMETNGSRATCRDPRRAVRTHLAPGASNRL